ncbi:MAG: 4Fe-4S binding protein [Tissierellia bacterium]|nr:NADH-dependent [FeFe] hydrogenase, group A6 [Bacillota bacterium]NLL22760.1 4Fe-4S binding protein [Tissierellia bacterium]
MIHLTINNMPIHVEEGTTILEAAKQLNIKIPTLCYLDLPDFKIINESTSCRVCVVEEVGRDKMLTACSTPCREGMNIRTDSIKVIKARRIMVELLLSNHPTDCLVCAKNGDCELQALAADVGIRTIRYPGDRTVTKIDRSSKSIIRDMSKCILCKRCETMCSTVQTVGTLTDVGRGFDTVVGTLFDNPMHETNCTFCGQCLAVCPTAALTEVNNEEKVWDALDSGKTVIVQTAPAVRVALGELFGMAPGTDVTGKMVSALRAMGFDRVYDTNFAADVTIIEEASELIHRLNNGERLPLLTSCCPSWVKFIEHNYGDMLDIPSSCKSPHEMLGSLAKTYLAEKMGIDPEDMIVVSVMPCVAKKYESARPELATEEGISDVDIVITTRELGHMLKDLSLDFPNLPDGEFDQLMGESSGAALIFGSSGGVIEAAVRTAYEWVTGEELEALDFTALRGLQGIKEAKVAIGDRELSIAVSSGLGNARKLLNRIRSGEAHYDAIEIMACPGGCIDGGGQPYTHGNTEIIQKRMNAIYAGDRKKAIRQSHKNPQVKKLYDEFLGEPYGEKAHQILHTKYTLRPKI